MIFDKMPDFSKNNECETCEYTLIEKIGKGEFSVIHKCQCNKSSKFYAFKEYTDANGGYNFENTSKMILTTYCVPYLSKIFYYIENRSVFIENGEKKIKSGLLMEYINGINLEQYMVAKKLKLNINQIQQIIKPLLIALKGLHMYGIIHRDIKPENIMIIERYIRISIKVIDFGLSTDKRISKEKKGTPLFMAPEVLEGKPYDEKIDVYSFGLVLYYLIEGKTIIDADDETISYNKKVQKLCLGFDNKLDKKCRSSHWKEYPFLFELFRNTIKKDPEERMTMNDAYDFYNDNYLANTYNNLFGKRKHANLG